MSTLKYYRDQLRINKGALDDELERHAQLQDEISRHLAVSNSEMLARKDALERITATVVNDLKADKLNDTVATGLAKKDPERMSAWRDFQDAREEHEEWLGLLAAWQSRGYGIKTLADLYVAQYYSLGTSIVQRDPQDAREALNASRRPLHRQTEQEPTTPTVRRRSITP